MKGHVWFSMKRGLRRPVCRYCHMVLLRHDAAQRRGRKPCKAR